MKNEATGRITADQIKIGIYREDGESYRAAYVGESVLTGPEHADLSDADLLAEAVAEARRADILEKVLVVECDLAGARVLMHERCYLNHCVIYEIPSEGNPDNAITKHVAAGWTCAHCHEAIE